MSKSKKIKKAKKALKRAAKLLAAAQQRTGDERARRKSLSEGLHSMLEGHGLMMAGLRKAGHHVIACQD